VIHFENLAYDADGRMIQSFLNPANPAVTLPVDTLSFDADNRLSNWNGQAVTMDKDGNMTAGPLPDGTLGAYVWDGRSRLASAGPVNYTYGPDEQLTGVDGANYAVDPNQRLSKTLVRTLGGGTTTYYVYGLGLIYEDTNGTMSTYHFDHVGSTVAITAADGNTVTDRMTWSSYGAATSRSGSTSTPFLFNGSLGVMTDSAGLLNMRARFYNPRIMRFISADPSGFGGGENWYAFVGNDPLTRFDPLGLWWAPKGYGKAGFAPPSPGKDILVGIGIGSIPVVVILAPEIAAGAGTVYEGAGATASTVLANPVAQKILLAGLLAEAGTGAADWTDLGDPLDDFAQSVAENFSSITDAADYVQLTNIIHSEVSLIEDELDETGGCP
jgi:RHS repeat-associated protein